MRVINNWNALLQKVESAPSLNAFKKKPWTSFGKNCRLDLILKQTVEFVMTYYTEKKLIFFFWFDDVECVVWTYCIKLHIFSKM